MARCDYCGKEMTAGGTCTVEPLLRRGVRRNLARARRQCGDCGVKAGRLHHLGCHRQRCPACRGQLISCGCVREENEFEFPTRLELSDAPVWAPLEAVARWARTRDDVPSFHEAEFMYMAAVHDDRRTIHLYKHIDTRRYLNLDENGTAYAYCGASNDDVDDGEVSGGWYVRYRMLADAIAPLELELFTADGLYRSFPPADWPPDDGGGSRAAPQRPA